MILKVKRGGSIIAPDHKVYKAGMVIPGGVLTAKQVQEHLKSGYLQVVKSPAARAPSLEEVKAAGYSDEAAKGIVEEAKAAVDDDGAVENPPGLDDTPGISAAGEPVKVKSRWDIDPDGLRGMSLDQLNVMVIERDDSVEPFSTVEEAVAWLSQDYEAEA